MSLYNVWVQLRARAAYGLLSKEAFYEMFIYHETTDYYTKSCSADDKVPQCMKLNFVREKYKLFLTSGSQSFCRRWFYKR